MQTTADSITTAVCGDSSVEIFVTFYDLVSSGFNYYVEVGLSTTEVKYFVCISVIQPVSCGTTDGVETDLTGARSVAVSVDAEDSMEPSLMVEDDRLLMV